MSPNRTPRVQSRSEIEIDDLIASMFNLLAAQNPAWKATLPDAIRDAADAIDARRTRRNRT